MLTPTILYIYMFDDHGEISKQDLDARLWVCVWDEEAMRRRRAMRSQHRNKAQLCG